MSAEARKDWKTKILEKSQRNYLRRMGLSNLVDTFFADPNSREKQKVLYEFFTGRRGKALFKKYNEKGWKESAARTIGFVTILGEKMNLLCSAILSNEIKDLTFDKIEKLVKFSTETSPDLFGTAHTLFLRILIDCEQKGFLEDLIQSKKFFELFKKFKEQNSYEDISNQMFCYIFISKYFETIVRVKESREVDIDILLEKLNLLLKEDLLQNSETYFSELFSTGDLDFLSQYVNLFVAMFVLTDGDKNLTLKLIGLAKEKPKGMEAIQMLDHFPIDQFSFLKEVLTYTPNNFFKYLFIFVKLNLLQRAGIIPANTLAKYSSPNIKVEDFSEESRNLQTFSTHSKILERRDTMGHKEDSPAYHNLTKEFSGPYFSEILKDLEKITEESFTLFFETIKKHNPDLSLEDLTKLEFMWEKYWKAHENKTSPYPSCEDVDTARKILDGIIHGKGNFKLNEKNITWARKVFGTKSDEWMTGNERKVFEVKNPKTGELEQITVEKENNTANIMLLGEKVNGSCYRPEGVNFWMSFVQAADTNKSVYYVKKQDGTILARFISAVSDEGKINFMPIYYSDTSIGLDSVQKEFAVGLARKYNLEISNHNINVERLHFSNFVSDYPVQFYGVNNVLDKVAKRIRRQAQRLAGRVRQ